MSVPTIAVVCFPGNNCEVESLRSVRRAGMHTKSFLWNSDTSEIADCEGFFIPGGFSYEDRGRAGMVAARDPVLEFLKEQAEKGKVIIGNCNGAQVLVESGLIPLGENLSMCLARNVIDGSSAGFLNEWIWITPSCKKNRCATSDWEGTMHIPIAHGEGRFTTQDKDLISELKENDQIAFSYSDEQGNVSEDPIVTPNGSLYAIAGICNPAGNVVALMPHPERTPNGDLYMASIKTWIEKKRGGGTSSYTSETPLRIDNKKDRKIEIFIDTIIVNNEERTVEQAARRFSPQLGLKQYRYIAPATDSPSEILTHFSHFNPNKEVAYIRRGDACFTWDSDAKKEVKADSFLESGFAMLRRDDPDTGSVSFGEGSVTGVCYHIQNVSTNDLQNDDLLQVFANPHASTLQYL